MLVRHLSIALLSFNLGIMLCPAQDGTQSQPGAGFAELDRLRPHLSRFLAVLPSLEAKESATSTQSLGGMTIREVHTTTQIRFTRARTNGQDVRSERYKVAADGSYAPISLLATLPLSLTGEFNEMPQLVNSQDFTSCLDIKVIGRTTTIQLQATAKPDVQTSNLCLGFSSDFACTLTMDAKSGQLLRLVRRFDKGTATTSNTALLLDVTYAPATLGKETFFLPSHIYAEDEKGDTFLGIYSDWHRYTTSTMLLLDDSAPPRKRGE